MKTAASTPDPEPPEKEKSESPASESLAAPGTAKRMGQDNRLAEAAAAAPRPVLTPSPLTPPPHPRVVELTAEAAAARSEADAKAAQADHLTVVAKLTGQKIGALSKNRDELAARLRHLEATDIPGHRAQCEASIKRLLGIHPLDHNLTIELNSSLTTLPALDAKSKLMPSIIKDVKARLAEIEKQLDELTGTGTCK
jgi:hypothetical protein